MLFYGNTAAQIIFLCAIPFLTRLYSPEMFGEFGFVLVITTLVGGIASLRYDEALIISEENETRHVLQLCCYLALFFAVISCLLVFAMTGVVDAFSTLSLSRGELSLVVFVGTLLTALSNCLQNYYIKRAYFKSISVLQLIRSIITVGLQFALVGFGAVGLIAGNLVGLLVAFLLIYLLILRTNQSELHVLHPLHLFSGSSIGHLKALAKQYRDFPLFDTPNTLLNSAAQGAPSILLLLFSGSAAVGAYTLIVRVLQKPVELITKPVRMVFFKKAVDISTSQPQRLLSIFRTVTLTLGLMSLLPSIFLFIKGPELFVWLFGEHWEMAGEFSRWVVIWIGVRIMNVPTTTMVRVLRMQDRMLVFGAILSLASIIALVAGLVFHSALVGIACFSLIGAAGNLVLIYWMDNCLQNHTASKAT